MPESDMSAAQGGSNNSSDFVRKLYKMLEDPNYSEVVRWGNEGDSFVVLENEKFTKTILPKHFKHSNFASFVRQLNKYDFHKVRQNEENGQSPYGPGAWEFKHPEFRADAKNSLDNIRRKAPAPRKATQPVDEQFSSNTQLVALTETLAATQQQVQALQDSYFQMAHFNKLFTDEIIHLRAAVKAQSSISSELINHLGKPSADRRHGSGASSHSTPAYNGNLLSDGTEEPPVELRRARDLLNGISIEHLPERDLRQMSIAFQQVGGSPESVGSSSIMGPPGTAGMNNNFIHDPMNDMRHMVYPVGQTIGIDPFAAEHMGNIPYNRPLSRNAMVTGSESNAVIPSVSPPGGASQGGSPWGLKKPRILLVEDDKTCSRIGSKFLSQYDCGVEVARDGLEAVTKVTSNPNWFDLIFMDIVMPQLDGVSATAMIRDIQPRVPIIAMTSNINQQDLEMYFHWGMRDVLAKPFTKEGMIGKLKKHLTSFLRNPPPDAVMDQMYQNGGATQPPTPGPFSNPAMSLPLSAASSSGVAKFDTTPIHSPSTSASWHSPGQMQHASPNLGQGPDYLNTGNGPQMVITPGGSQRPPYSSTMMPTMGPGARMPDSLVDEGPPEKRQRLYGPASTFAQ